MDGKVKIVYIVPTLNAANICLQFCQEWQLKLATSVQNDVSIQMNFIDGGSTDGTVELLEKNFLNCVPNTSLRIVPGCTIYQAWNIAIDEIVASDLPHEKTWLGFIGLDDLPHSLDVLSRVAEVSDCYNYVSFRHGKITPHQDAFTIESLRVNGMRFCHAGSLHRIDLFGEGNRFSETYRIVGDYEFLCRNINFIQTKIMDASPLNIQSGGISSSFKVINETIKIRKSFIPKLSKYEIYKMALRQFISILALKFRGFL